MIIATVFTRGILFAGITMGAFCLGKGNIPLVFPGNTYEANYLIDVDAEKIVAVTRNEYPPSLQEARKRDPSNDYPRSLFAVVNQKNVLAYLFPSYGKIMIEWNIVSKEAKKIVVGNGEYWHKAIALRPGTDEVWALLQCTRKEGEKMDEYQQLAIYDPRTQKVIRRIDFDKPTYDLYGVTPSGEVLLSQMAQTTVYYRKTHQKDWKPEERQARLTFLNPETGETRYAKPPDLESLCKGEKGKPSNVKWWVQDNEEYFLIAAVQDVGEKKEKTIIGYSVLTRKVGKEEVERYALDGELFKSKEYQSLRGTPVVSADGKAIFLVGGELDGKNITRIDLKKRRIDILDLETPMWVGGGESMERPFHLVVSADGDAIVYYGAPPYLERMPPEDRKDEIKRKYRFDIVIADGTTGKTRKNLWVPLELPKWEKEEKK